MYTGSQYAADRGFQGKTRGRSRQRHPGLGESLLSWNPRHRRARSPPRPASSPTGLNRRPMAGLCNRLLHKSPGGRGEHYHVALVTSARYTHGICTRTWCSGNRWASRPTASPRRCRGRCGEACRPLRNSRRDLAQMPSVRRWAKLGGWRSPPRPASSPTARGRSGRSATRDLGVGIAPTVL